MLSIDRLSGEVLQPRVDYVMEVVSWMFPGISGEHFSLDSSAPLDH